MPFTRQELLDIADKAGKAGNDADAADAMKMLDELDASNKQKNLTAFKNASAMSRVGTTLGDLLGTATHGISLGMDDRAAAGLHAMFSGDVDYDQALAEEQANTKARNERMEFVNPGSTTAIEALSSFAAPGGVLKAGATKAVPWAGRGGRIVADMLENAGYGATSAYGHGQDVGTGAAVGAAGTLAAPLLRYVTPAAAKYGLASAAASAGGSVGGFPGAWLAGDAGRTVGGAVAKGAANTMDTAPGRGILATIARAPGRLYGWAAGGGSQ